MMINKTEKFVIKEIHRSEIKNAPYNPRMINEKQRAGLKRNLKKIGLVYPLVWNESTGNLVSGHQRISLCDEINGTDDYTLTMSVVQLSLKDEIQQNTIFNLVSTKINCLLSYENTDQAKNIDAYVIMSFSNIENKEAFCRRFDIPIGETIFKGEVFSNMVERVE
jgi:hypothetical protein